MRDNVLLKAMIEKNMTMYDLKERTGICTSRISAFRNDRQIPNRKELKQLNLIMESNLKRSDFKIDWDGKKQERVYKKIEKRISKELRTKNRGFIKCPKCKKKVEYVISEINGHLTAMCETGCFFSISSRKNIDAI